jgi:hypothetical protein
MRCHLRVLFLSISCDRFLQGRFWQELGTWVEAGLM